MSRVVEVVDNEYTFYIKSEFEPDEITVEANNADEATNKAIMMHYGYDAYMEYKDFCDWLVSGPDDFAPTAALIHDDMRSVLYDINRSWAEDNVQQSKK